MLIGFTSRLICFRTFWSVLLLLFLFFFRMQVPEKSVCLHAAFRQSLSLFFFLLLLALLIRRNKANPSFGLKKKKESETLKKTKWRYRRTKEKCLKRFFFFCLLRGSQLTESFVPRPTHRGTVCLAHLAFYLNLSGQRADFLWMYLKLWFFTTSQSHQTRQPITP